MFDLFILKVISVSAPIFFSYQIQCYESNGYMGRNIDYSHTLRGLHELLLDEILNSKILRKLLQYSNHSPKYESINMSQATKIAESIMIRKIGFNYLRLKPYNTALIKNNTWRISTTVPSFEIKYKNNPLTNSVISISFYYIIDIRKSDGKILNIKRIGGL
jgi:hypothetical protein